MELKTGSVKNAHQELFQLSGWINVALAKQVPLLPTQERISVTNAHLELSPRMEWLRVLSARLDSGQIVRGRYAYTRDRRSAITCGQLSLITLQVSRLVATLYYHSMQFCKIDVMIYFPFLSSSSVIADFSSLFSLLFYSLF